jgi:hypothetical protein
VLASTKSTADARSERALGFQEAGLLGVHRNPTSAPRRGLSERFSPQIGTRFDTFMPLPHLLNGLSNEMHHAAVQSTRTTPAHSAQSGTIVIDLSLSPMQAVGTAPNKLSFTDGAKRTVSKTGGNSALLVATAQRKRRESVSISDEDHTISVLVGSPSLDHDMIMALHQDLICLFQQFGVTLKGVMINGNSGVPTKSCTEFGG